GTRGAGPRASLGHVAGARSGAAHRPRIAGRMLTQIATAVTGVGRARVAIVGAGRAVRFERATGRAARAGGAVRRAVVTLLAGIDHTVAARYVGHGNPDRVHCRCSRMAAATLPLLRRARSTDV